MPTTSLDPLPPAALAEQAVEALKASSGVLGLCLLGSVARGDERPESDVDVLVAIGPATTARAVALGLPQDLRWRPLSLICKTPQSLDQMAKDGSLFLAHARTEGRVVFDPDGILATVFAVAAAVPLDPRAEIQRRAASLKYYQQLERFGGNFLFALAHLYAIGKGVAIARCTALGQTTFVKSEALARLAHARPDLRDDIKIIEALRPFYDMTRGHSGAVPPFPYVGADAETQQAVRAVARLAALADDTTGT